jgi:hypothetical protein
MHVTPDAVFSKPAFTSASTCSTSPCLARDALHSHSAPRLRLAGEEVVGINEMLVVGGDDLVVSIVILRIRMSWDLRKV